MIVIKIFFQIKEVSEVGGGYLMERGAMSSLRHNTQWGHSYSDNMWSQKLIAHCDMTSSSMDGRITQCLRHAPPTAQEHHSPLNCTLIGASPPKFPWKP